MKIGVLQLQVYIADCSSLKQKRSKLARLKKSLRKKFNISISELGEKNNFQASQLGIALLGQEGKYINSKFDKILKYFKHVKNIQIVNYDIQLI